MIRFGVEQHGHEIARQAGCFFNPLVDKVISRESNGKLLGGIVYKDYTGASIAMHVGRFARNWVCRDLLWVAFHYPFEQLDCSRVFGFIPSTNTQSLDFAYRLSFKYVTTVPGVYRDGDMIVLVMERDVCPWLKLSPRYLHEGGSSHGK